MFMNEHTSAESGSAPALCFFCTCNLHYQSSIFLSKTSILRTALSIISSHTSEEATVTNLKNIIIAISKGNFCSKTGGKPVEETDLERWCCSL